MAEGSTPSARYVRVIPNQQNNRSIVQFSNEEPFIAKGEEGSPPNGIVTHNLEYVKHEGDWVIHF